MGPVIGSIASVVGPEPVFSSAAVLGTGLAIWTYMTPAPAPTAFPGWARLRRTVASRSVAAGFWLVMLPAAFSGVIWVLTPLRLDELGASGLAVGAVFLVSALVEGAASPAFGRLSDRRGRIWPIRIGLFAAAPCRSCFCPCPRWSSCWGCDRRSPSWRWASAGRPPWRCSPTPSRAPASSSGLLSRWSNLAWAGGQVVGGSGGGGLADATSDGLTYAVVAGLLALTAAAITVRLRERAVAGRGRGRVTADGRHRTWMSQPPWARSGCRRPLDELASRRWDVIVVGGGHNGLTAAAYLRQGRPVGAGP